MFDQVTVFSTNFLFKCSLTVLRVLIPIQHGNKSFIRALLDSQNSWKLVNCYMCALLALIACCSHIGRRVLADLALNAPIMARLFSFGYSGSELQCLTQSPYWRGTPVFEVKIVLTWVFWDLKTKGSCSYLTSDLFNSWLSQQLTYSTASWHIQSDIGQSIALVKADSMGFGPRSLDSGTARGMMGIKEVVIVQCSLAWFCSRLIS